MDLSGAFSPPPRVRSAFVRLVPWRESPFPAIDPGRYAELVRVAFSKRRKTLRNALRGLLEVDEIVAAGVDPGARPETLDPAAFARLSVA